MVESTVHLIISNVIRDKLAHKVPPVSEEDIRHCFGNQTHEPLVDTREEHQTDPITRWIVAEAPCSRMLKVIYVPREDGVFIKSAYDATEEIQRIYYKYAKPFPPKPTKEPPQQA